MFDFFLSAETFASTIRYSVPLVLACIAGLWSERAGIVDIGLEGKMLIAAFAAAVVATPHSVQFGALGLSWFTVGNPWLALFVAIFASMSLSVVHGYASINQRGNQVISGFAITMFALGLTAVLGHELFKEGGRTPALPEASRFMPLEPSFAQSLYDLPVLGYFAKIILGHSILTYIAFATVALTAWALAKTRFGLRLRAVGENPHAVDTAGISVSKLRYQAVIIAGLLCGIAGAFLSISLSASFVNNMVSGRGYLALAALILANWRAWPCLWACLLFGYLEAIRTKLQGVPVFGVEIPVQFVNMLPYMMTVILLAGFIGKSIPPKASGTPYTKDR